MRSVTWDDFSAGEYGGEDPRKWPKGAWSGVNVVRYVDGSIGPRAGFARIKRFTWTTVAGSLQFLTGIAVSPVQEPAGQRDLWVMGGVLTEAQLHALEIADPVNSGLVTSVPNEASQLVTGGARLVTKDPDPCLFACLRDGNATLRKYSTSAVLGLVSGWPIIGSPVLAGGGMFVYGSRLVMGGHNPASIIFSNPEDFLTWGRDNYVKLPSAFSLGIARQRSHLIAASQEGIWSVLTGSMTSATLRAATSSETLDVELIPVDTGGRAWSFSSATFNPVSFDGSQVDVVSRVQLPYGVTLDAFYQSATKRYLMSRGVAMKQPGDVALMMGLAGPDHPWLLILRRGRGWSRHRTYLGPSGNFPGAFRYDMDCASGDRLVVSRSGAVTSTPPTWNVTTDVLLSEQGIEHPPFKIGATGARQWEDSYDDGVAYTTELDLPQHWDPDTDVVLRGVTIDFKKFSTGDTRTNHFDIMIEAHGRRDKGTLASTQTFTFDEANAGGVSGTDESRTFWFGDQAQGRGFQAHLSNLRGVALRGVTAHYEPVGSV